MIEIFFDPTPLDLLMHTHVVDYTAEFGLDGISGEEIEAEKYGGSGH